MTLRPNTLSDAGWAFTGHTDNNAGFSWSYQDRMRWSEGRDEIPVTNERRIEVQSMFCGQVSEPAFAVIDDFGTLVIPA